MKKWELQTLQARLPQPPGLHARERYLNSAVLIPLVIKGDDCYLLFQKRSAHIRQGGEICFPGGRHDPRCDASYEETAIRETVEELGVQRYQIRIVGQLDTYFAPHGVTIDPFIGILDIDGLEDLMIDSNEVERVFLLPVSYFEKTPPREYHVRVEVQPSYIDKYGNEQILLPVKELGLPERYASPWGGRMYTILVYQTPEDPIWGMTAGMLSDLIQKLRSSS